MKIRTSLVLTAILVVAATTGSVARQERVADPLPRAESRDRNLRAYVELLRRDLRSQKVALITELMEFTDAEDKVFWPVYREYEIEQTRIYDERIKLIEKYADTYTNMTDAQANELVMANLDLEARRTALKKKYYTSLKAVLSPKVAARAVQVEHQLDLLAELQVAASLPVVTLR